MQTSTHETAPRRARSAPGTRRAAPAVNRKPVYPDLPSIDHRLFWLAAYLRGIAEADALDALHTEAIRRKRSRVTSYALCGAHFAAKDKAKTTAEHTRGDGLILFAHPATTIFSQQRGAA